MEYEGGVRECVLGTSFEKSRGGGGVGTKESRSKGEEEGGMSMGYSDNLGSMLAEDISPGEAPCLVRENGL